MSFFQTLKFINNHELAKKHRLRAVARFLKWQFSQKIYPHPVVYPFISNTKLWVQKGMTGATGNIYTGLHEFNDMAFLLHFLRASDWFIDVGANVGSYSILASGVVGAHSISIEPVPQTFKKLEKNIDINGIQAKVLAMNIGIASAKASLRFSCDADTVNHVLKDQMIGDDTVEVDVNTLDGILENLPIPTLIKIDVEGFEQEVINGATKLLQSTTLKAIIIELNGSGGRYGFDEKNIHHQIKEAGFSPFSYDPFSRSLTPMSNFGLLNTIYLREIDFVEERLKTAPNITVFSESF
jgi:FkbM family methyltransferase